MTATPTADADWQVNHLAGIQLAIFELVWGGYAWLSAIWFDLPSPSLTIRAVTLESAELPKGESDRFQRQMNEILDIALAGEPSTVSYSVWPPGQPPGGVELFSGSIFHEIAKEVAP